MVMTSIKIREDLMACEVECVDSVSLICEEADEPVEHLRGMHSVSANDHSMVIVDVSDGVQESRESLLTEVHHHASGIRIVREISLVELI